MRRLLTAALLTAVLLVLLLAGGAWWLFSSENGTRWLWNRVAATVPGELVADSIDGALTDGFSARGVRYADTDVEVEIDAVAFSLHPRLLPLSATLSGVRIGEVTVRQRNAPSPAGGEPVTVRRVLSVLRLPLRLRIDSLALDSLRVLSHDQHSLFAMRSVTLAGDLHDALAFDEAQVRLDGLQLEARGSLGLDAPNAVDGSVAVRIDRHAVGQFPDMPLIFDARLEGDLDELRLDVSGGSPEFRVTGSVAEAGSNPRWDLRFRSDHLQWPFADKPVVIGQAIDLASEGGIDKYTVHGSADIDVLRSGPLRMVIDAVGDTLGIDVSRLDLSGGLAEATAHGALDWAGGLEIRGMADVARVDPQQYLEVWPAMRFVSGQLDAAWRAGSIDVSALHAEVANSPMTLDASGTIDADNGVVDLALDWRELQWPVGGAQPQVASDKGRVRVTGHFDDWLVDGRIALRIPGFPEGSFALRGKGDQNRAALTVDESEILGGTAAGTVQYDWQAGSFAASLQTDDLHTQPLTPRWPGVLDATFDASGRLDPFIFSVELHRFEGTMRGLPVAGSGEVRYAPGKLHFGNLRIDSGASSVVVDGDLRGPNGIDFSIDVDAMGAFVPDATGAIDAKGNLSMHGEFPLLRLELDGHDVAWRQYRAATLSVSSLDATAELPLHLALDAEDITLDERHLDTVTAELAAGPDAQRLDSRITAADAVLAAALEGAFEDWRHPLASAWNGRLSSLTLNAGQEFALALREPAALHLSPGAYGFDEACLAGEGALQICGSGHWSGRSDFLAKANLSAFPVDTLRLLVDTGLEFTQTLDGAMTFGRKPGQAVSGDVRLDVSGGRISNRLDSLLETTTRPGQLEMHLDNGRLLSGQLKLPFSRASQIDGEFRVVDVAQGDASPVLGQLNLTVADIGVAANILPAIDSAAGSLDANVRISGTVGQPRFAGQGALRDGRLSYEPIGLKLTDIQLRGDIKEENRLELQGTFTAGKGSGRLYSSADYLAGRQAGLRVSLSGQNLTVIDVPDVRVVANPELEFGLNEGAVSINGRVVVPKARLKPGNLTENRVRQSDDVVIVAGEDTADREEAEEKSSVAINGQVDLVLGDDIVVDLDTTEAKVSGKSSFRWAGPPVPIADGQYEVKGRFQAYGQLLEITEGTISFSHSPADNPVLRIRAEREIFGNSQIRSAGILISGTASDPDVEVYTNPETTEARALTLLVTGSDFNYEQGVGAVDVGTYIAPKLYLSYGIGLFDRENVISLRYDFAKGLGIKASSSARTDGVDISYTIER